MTDDVPILDYGTRTPNPDRAFDVVESPDGAVALVIPPRAPWRTAATVVADLLAAGGFALGARTVFAPHAAGSWPWAALFACVALGFAGHAAARFAGRRVPTVLSVAAGAVTLTRPSWGRPRARTFPRPAVRGLHLRRLGLGVTFRPLGELWLVPRGRRLPVRVCTGPHAPLAVARARLELAIRSPAGFPVILSEPKQQQGGSSNNKLADNRDNAL